MRPKDAASCSFDCVNIDLKERPDGTGARPVAPTHAQAGAYVATGWGGGRTAYRLRDLVATGPGFDRDLSCGIESKDAPEAFRSICRSFLARAGVRLQEHW